MPSSIRLGMILSQSDPFYHTIRGESATIISAMPNISGSQGRWDHIPRFVARRPGGGVPHRLDTTTTASPATELDVALGFTIHDDHHDDDDDDFSIGSPSVATAVTANISPVSTPDVDDYPPPPSRMAAEGGGTASTTARGAIRNDDDTAVVRISQEDAKPPPSPVHRILPRAGGGRCRSGKRSGDRFGMSRIPSCRYSRPCNDSDPTRETP